MNVADIDAATESELVILDDETGQIISVAALDDLELSEWQLRANAQRREWELLERALWDEIRRRAKANRGWTDGKRKLVVRRKTIESVAVEGE